jgi:hypothetical protein
MLQVIKQLLLKALTDYILIPWLARRKAKLDALVAQRTEQSPPKGKVVGSIPTVGTTDRQKRLKEIYLKAQKRRKAHGVETSIEDASPLLKKVLGYDDQST